MARGDAGAGPVPSTGEDGPVARNEVLLVGRVAAAPEQRELPSGDRLVVWRLVVDRPAERRPVAAGRRPPVVDTLDCVAWTAAARRSAARLVAGDVARVTGALRRRFWRAGAGAASRYEVEVAAVARLLRAPAARRRTRRSAAPGAGDASVQPHESLADGAETAPLMSSGAPLPGSAC